MSAHEVVFNAVNGVHRDPKLSFDCANAVLHALDAAGYTLTARPTRLVPAPAVKASGEPQRCDDRQHWDFTKRPLQRMGESSWWCQVCWKRLPDGWQPTGVLPAGVSPIGGTTNE